MNDLGFTDAIAADLRRDLAARQHAGRRTFESEALYCAQTALDFVIAGVIVATYHGWDALPVRSVAQINDTISHTTSTPQYLYDEVSGKEIRVPLSDSGATGAGALASASFAVLLVALIGFGSNRRSYLLASLLLRLTTTAAKSASCPRPLSEAWEVGWGTSEPAPLPRHFSGQHKGNAPPKTPAFDCPSDPRCEVAGRFSGSGE